MYSPCPLVWRLSALSMLIAPSLLSAAPTSPTASDFHLVLLAPSAHTEALRTSATLSSVAGRTVAVVPAAQLSALKRTGAVEKVLPGDPSRDEWFITRWHAGEAPDQLPVEPTLWSAGGALLHCSPAQAIQAAHHGHLERITPLPNLEHLASPVQASASPEDVTALVDRVTEESWYQWVLELSGELPVDLPGGTRALYSRHTDHPDNTAAGEFMADQLEAMGYQVTFQEFLYNGNVERNVVATLTGTTRPSDVYVFGGHYDSRSEMLSDSTSPAPGADDNGSGTAAVLEAARVMADQRPQATLEFVLFAAEEQGLIGSQEYVKAAKTSGKRIKGAILTDMVSYWARDYRLIVEGTPRYRTWMKGATDAAEQWSDLPTVSHWYSFGSDHISFQNAGIPAYLLIEMEWDTYPDYHSTDDVAANCDPHMGAEVTRIAVGALASAAGL